MATNQVQVGLKFELIFASILDSHATKKPLKQRLFHFRQSTIRYKKAHFANILLTGFWKKLWVANIGGSYWFESFFAKNVLNNISANLGSRLRFSCIFFPAIKDTL